MSDDVRALLASMRVPDALHRRLHQDAALDEIEIGQIWQVHWDDTSTLVLVVAVRDSERARVLADVVAVTLAHTAPTGSSVPTLLQPTDALEATTVWLSTRTALPARVFERMLVPAAQTRPAVEAAAAQPPAGAGAGEALDALDPGLELWAELKDALEELAEAPGLPVKVEAAGDLATRMSGDTVSKLRALVEILGVGQPSAQLLLRGKAQPTAAQLESLVAAGVVQGSAAVREAFPEDTVAELEHPRTKADVLAAARRLGLPEAEVRLAAARQAYALAARITGTPEPVAARVRHALAELR